jgi:hypothetical protein
MTGWGDEIRGEGVAFAGAISPNPHPWIASPRHRAVFAAPARVDIVTEAILYETMYRDYVLTNLSIFLDSATLATAARPSKIFSASTAPLEAGAYSIRVTMGGYFGWPGPGKEIPHAGAAGPITFTVVDPIETVVDGAQIADGRFTFNYTANPGLKYVVARSTDLINWLPVSTNVPIASPALFSDHVNSAAFYKVDRFDNP